MADSGRAGEVAAGVGLVRSLAFLSILRERPLAGLHVRAVEVLARHNGFTAACQCSVQLTADNWTGAKDFSYPAVCFHRFLHFLWAPWTRNRFSSGWQRAWHSPTKWRFEAGSCSLRRPVSPTARLSDTRQSIVRGCGRGSAASRARHKECVGGPARSWTYAHLVWTATVEPIRKCILTIFRLSNRLNPAVLRRTTVRQ